MAISFTSPKEFRGKRIYVSSNYPGIKKVLIWNDKTKKYASPIRGANYQVRKQVFDLGKEKTITKQYSTLQECFNFRSSNVAQEMQIEKSSPTILNLIAEYRRSPSWELLDYTTQIMYIGIFERWFDYSYHFRTYS
jgi:hypothetical protein